MVWVKIWLRLVSRFSFEKSFYLLFLDGGTLSLPVLEVPRKCFGSVDCDDGSKEYAKNRGEWPEDLKKVVDRLENLYHLDFFEPPSLALDSDQSSPSVVYHCPVQIRAGFSRGDSGWGPEKPLRKKFRFF